MTPECRAGIRCALAGSVGVPLGPLAVRACKGSDFPGRHPCLSPAVVLTSMPKGHE